MPKSPNIIVGETSQSWGEHDPQQVKQHVVIAQKFELMIATNDKRGYRLKAWRYGVVAYPGAGGAPLITETIIAVFVRRGSLADAESREED